MREQNAGLISSVGMPTWELLTALGQLNNLSLKIILPAETEARFRDLRDETIRQFQLDESRVTFMPSANSGVARDRIALEEAESIIPVSIRSRGILEGLIEEIAVGKELIDDFRTRYEKRKVPLSYTLEGVTLNPELYSLEEAYITHWTRGSILPWPNETKLDFYRAILESDRYPRQAIDSLSRIVKSKTILSTAKNMPHSIKTVSFSGAGPYDIVKLIKWRARQRRMSFEPYGIGIERGLALSMGIKPVRYYDRNSDTPDTSVEPWLWQSQGMISDWRDEQEVRSLGDFDLRGIPHEQLIMFCLLPDEARELSARHQIRAVSFLPK